MIAKKKYLDKFWFKNRWWAPMKITRNLGHSWSELARGRSFEEYTTKVTYSSFISWCCMLSWGCKYSCMHSPSKLSNLLKFNMVHAELYLWPLLYRTQEMKESISIWFNFIPWFHLRRFKRYLNSWCTKPYIILINMLAVLQKCLFLITKKNQSILKIKWLH